MSDSDTIVCPKCESELITANYSTEIYINEMVVEEYKETKYRYCESTDHYLDGDFSDTLMCMECSHTWEPPDWQNWKVTND